MIGGHIMSTEDILNDPELIVLILAILVKRLGGAIKITQPDVDIMAGSILKELIHPDGCIELQLIQE